MSTKDKRGYREHKSSQVEELCLWLYLQVMFLLLFSLSWRNQVQWLTKRRDLFNYTVLWYLKYAFFYYDFKSMIEISV